MQPGTERRINAEPCDPSDVAVLPNAAYLEVGGTFAFSLAQVEKTHSASVTLDSHRAPLCRGAEFALPAHATTCVDRTNARDARCDIPTPPFGGSVSCAETNHWVEKISFHLSRVLSDTRP
jgi:hypothetical protein